MSSNPLHCRKQDRSLAGRMLTALGDPEGRYPPSPNSQGQASCMSGGVSGPAPLPGRSRGRLRSLGQHLPRQAALSPGWVGENKGKCVARPSPPRVVLRGLCVCVTSCSFACASHQQKRG